MYRVRTHRSGFVVQSQVLGRQMRHAGTGERRLVRVVGHTDSLGRCPRAFVTPQPLPSALSSSGHYPQVLGEFCFVAISLLLLGQSFLASLPIQTPAQPRAGLPVNCVWNMAGSGQGLGAAGGLPK